MGKSSIRAAVRVATVSLVAGVAGAGSASQPSSIDYLAAPFSITRILDWGERPDWSPDGKRIAFTKSDVQDTHAYEIDVTSRKVRCLTCRWGPQGLVTRIYYLPDGNFLILGPRRKGTAAKGFDGEIYWMPASLESPPQPLGATAFGELAISRRVQPSGAIALAWGTSAETPQLMMADLVRKRGRAELGPRKVVYRATVPYRPDGPTFPETYNFAKNDRAITFWTIEPGTMNGEMYEVDINSGALRNWSRNPVHDETHLFPDERFGLEESNRASDPSGSLRGVSSLPAMGISAIGGWIGAKVPSAKELADYAPFGPLRGAGRPFDLYVIALDGSGRLRRLTEVSHLGGNAHQSVPAADGRRIAFALQAPSTGPLAKRSGLYIGEFDRRPERKVGQRR